MFEQDKYLALIQGGVNLVISIALVQRMGLVGIYIGTIVSGLIANVTKPFIIYKACFDKGVKEYFMETAKHLVILGIVLALVIPMSQILLREITIVSFVMVGILIVIIYNVLFLLVYRKTKEMGYLVGIVKGKLKQ